MQQKKKIVISIIIELIRIVEHNNGFKKGNLLSLSNP